MLHQGKKGILLVGGNAPGALQVRFPDPQFPLFDPVLPQGGPRQLNHLRRRVLHVQAHRKGLFQFELSTALIPKDGVAGDGAAVLKDGVVQLHLQPEQLVAQEELERLRLVLACPHRRQAGQRDRAVYDLIPPIAQLAGAAPILAHHLKGSGAVIGQAVPRIFKRPVLVQEHRIVRLGALKQFFSAVRRFQIPGYGRVGQPLSPIQVHREGIPVNFQDVADIPAAQMKKILLLQKTDAHHSPSFHFFLKLSFQTHKKMSVKSKGLTDIFGLSGGT